jgi:hypothetical protein
VSPAFRLFAWLDRRLFRYCGECGRLLEAVTEPGVGRFAHGTWQLLECPKYRSGFDGLAHTSKVMAWDGKKPFDERTGKVA